MTSAERNRAITRAVVTSILGLVAVYTLYLIGEVVITVYIRDRKSTRLNSSH